LRIGLGMAGCRLLGSLASCRAGEKWQDHGLVFASVKGTPLDAHSIVNRCF
jgi:hypothetical protein